MICHYYRCSSAKCSNEVWLYVEAEVHCAKCHRPMKKTRTTDVEHEARSTQEAA